MWTKPTENSHQRLPFPTAIISEFTRIVPVNSLWQSGMRAHNYSDSFRTHYSGREEFSMAEIAGMGHFLDSTNDIIATEAQQISILCWAGTSCWHKRNIELHYYRPAIVCIDKQMQPATKLSLWHGRDASCGERDRDGAPVNCSLARIDIKN